MNNSAPQPSPAALELIQSSHDLVKGLLAAQGLTMAPDSDFTTVSGLAHHYGMPRKDFLGVLDRAGIRRRKDGVPSDLALKADAARLVPLTNHDTNGRSSPETYWRWNRQKVRALLVATGAMKEIDSNRVKQAIKMAGLQSPQRPTSPESCLDQQIHAVDDSANGLLRLLKEPSRHEQSIAQSAEALRKASSTLRRLVKKAVGAGTISPVRIEAWTNSRVALAKDILAIFACPKPPVPTPGLVTPP